MDINELIVEDTILKDGVYQLKNGIFAYSDGDAAENYIYEVLQSATDISSRSAELEEKIIDWSSRYHFSSSRANSYRAFNFKSGAKVLEIGSGCGSITRYLGEVGLDVVALEGSNRRSAITRSRTRDLANVTVICGSFGKIKFKTTFDYIICNGVLEYVPLFVESPSPADLFLKQISELLGNGGALFLAIENKLGLRYFTSCKEEHTGIMYDGIEDYHRFPKGPRTYSKAALLKTISQYFDKVDLLLPLPDYKFPRAVIREELTKLVECGELFGVLEDYDYPTLSKPNFHQRLGWHTVADAGLLSELSNSHLFIAYKGTIEVLEKNWQGEIFKNDFTSKAFRSTTIVSKKIDGKVVIGLIDSAPSYEKNNKFSPWIDGRSMHSLIASGMLRKVTKSLDMPDINQKISLWWSVISKSSDGTVSSCNIDAIWRNAIYKNNQINLIDQDFESITSTSGAHLIYRTVLNFVADEIHFVHRWSLRNRLLSEFQLVSKISDIVGIEIKILDLLRAVQQEIYFQIRIGNRPANFLSRLARMITPIIIIKFICDIKSGTSRLTQRIKRRLCKHGILN
jgi:SAM-dependent methyltransferase